MTSAQARRPAYMMIQRELEHKIVSGELRPGQRLAAERELQAEYGVSRITAQRAVNGLVAKGLVSRRAGAGTFISRVAEEQNLLQFMNFMSDGVAIPGAHRLLSASLIPAREAAVDLPGMGMGEPVHRLERLKIGDEGPAALELSFVPFRHAPKLADEDLGELHLYGYFRNLGLAVDSARMYISPVALSEHQAELLSQPANALTLLWERISRLDDGSVVEVSHLIISDSRRRFFVESFGFPAV